jgi:hypothetical protein
MNEIENETFSLRPMSSRVEKNTERENNWEGKKRSTGNGPPLNFR